MKKTAIVYASHDGHTQHISETLYRLMNEKGLPTTLIHVDDFDAEQLSQWDFVIFGSPIRYGKHLPEMVDFLTANQTTLSQKDTAFFSVNLTARKPNRNTPQTSNYVKKLLATLTWQPNVVAVFAGKLNYPIYRFVDKQMIRLIMWITKGPTDANSVIDFTDWQQVSDFAETLYQRGAE